MRIHRVAGLRFLSRGTLVLLLATSGFAHAQVALSARDSATLVAAIVADLRANYKPFANGVFVFDTTRSTAEPLTTRVLTALRSSDSTAAPLDRTAWRVRFGNLTFTGDTAAIMVSASRCTFEPREWVSGTTATHRYIRTGEGWESEPRRSVAVGDGLRCPY